MIVPGPTVDTCFKPPDYLVAGCKVPREVYERVRQLTERNKALQAALDEAHPFGHEAAPPTGYDLPRPYPAVAV